MSKKKISALIIFVLICAVAYVLYRYVPTTPVLIINLTVIFLAVLNLFIAFKTKDEILKMKKNHISGEHLPELETALIYITPRDFANKIDLGEGTFWNAFETEELNLELREATFDKLKDELSIVFNKGYNLKITGITTIPIGDNQFHIYGFKELNFNKNKNNLYQLKWESSGLVINQDSTKELLILEDGVPCLIWEWEREEEEN